MSSNSPELAFDPAILIRAAEGLTQFRPVVLGFLSFAAAVLLSVAGTVAGQSISGGFGGLTTLVAVLAALIVMAAGYSGVGILLMDKARQQQPRTLTDAMLGGLMCLPKFIGLAFVLLATILGMTLVAALVYLICKIPGLGPVLLFIAHPALVVASAVVLVAVFWVAIPMFAPAVWDGRGFKESLSLLYAVARQRLMATVVNLLGLYLVTMVVGALMVVVLVPAFGFMTVIAGGIIGTGLDSTSGLVVLATQVMAGGGGSGASYALGLSSVLIFAVGFSLMTQVTIMGSNLAYLSVCDGLDVAGAHAALNAGLQAAKERAQEAQERARQLAERGRAANATAQSAAASAPKSMPACPACGVAITSGDVFCGSCGHRLH